MNNNYLLIYGYVFNGKVFITGVQQVDYSFRFKYLSKCLDGINIDGVGTFTYITNSRAFYTGIIESELKIRGLLK